MTDPRKATVRLEDGSIVSSNLPLPGWADPRIDPLGSSAILTDTQVRVSFAPHDPDVRVVALKANSRQLRLDQMQSLMALGRVHLQVKAGFGIERAIELSPPEVMVIFELLDRFVTELPRAQQAKALPDG